ncbi:hypothetical protein MJM04_31190, partial [Salmonella enterica subsp. enterica serovar Cerro]|nr:hypothetical protein [Salmonella enterica subsp. enterica serovar Cerro]
DCGGKCDIRAHVSDGIVTRISTRPDNALDAQMPVMRACVRGRYLSIRISRGEIFLALRDLSSKLVVEECLPLPLTEATPLLERI